MNERERAGLAASCLDCNGIPKVDRAGEIDTIEGVEVQIMHNGLRTRTDSHYGDYNVDVIKRLKGHHEPQEELVFHEVLKTIPSGGTMLELGSFWAYYSLWFLHEVSDGRAIMLEPVPEALEAGRRNFEINDRKGEFIHSAISHEVHEPRDIELWPGKTTHAPTKTVDSIVKEYDVDRLSILHADIQGHEVQMLKGAKQFLQQRRIDWVFISTHHENIHQACIKELGKHGYWIVAEHSLGESFSVDGLIVASATHYKLRAKISRRKSWPASYAKLRAKIRVTVLEPIGLRSETL